MTSMLAVFSSKRNKSQAHKSRKFSTIIPRRAQSPPSPASFESPEIVDIQEKGPFGATVPDARGPSNSIDRSVPVTSPQLQLDFEDSGPLAEWLPPSILHPSENRTPPKRNVSLPNGGRDLLGSGHHTRAPSDLIKEEVEPREPNRLFVDTSFQYHPRSSSEEPHDNNAPYSTRKPTPSPIKIPNNVTSAKIRVQRSSPDDNNDTGSGIPPPLPTKGSRPSSPSSAVTDDMSSAISGSSLAQALHVNSFILSNESRASKYKSGGMTRQDSATLPRGEHPLNNNMYLRERRASVGSPESARSSSVPPVPRLPSRAELGLSMDSTALGKRSSVASELDGRDSDQVVPPLKRPKSTGRLRREQTLSMPLVSPISEASSPAPSLPNTPVIIDTGHSNASNASSRSLANSAAPPRNGNLEGNASSSSLGTGEGLGHVRAATELATRPSTGGSTSSSTRQKEAPRKGSLVPNAAMPGTMRSSGAFAVNGRLAVTRTISETGVPRGGMSQPARPAVLLPIGERPASMLVPSSQPSVGLANASSANPTPTSARFGSFSSSETPVDSPDLLDNFPVQISRPSGPPPPLPLGRRSSEENGGVPAPMHSSSGESMLSTDRQTFPETPNAFSPLWSASFMSPPANGSRTSLDRSSSRGGPSRVLDIMRMAQRGASGPRMSGSVLSKPTTRSSRIPPTPPLTGESGSSADSPQTSNLDPPASPLPQAGAKRLTAIEEQVASRAVSTYSTLPEPPTSGAMYTTFATQQTQSQAPLPGRDRSGSVNTLLSNATSQNQAPGFNQNQSQNQGQGQYLNASTTLSPAAQAKAAEASSHRRMRSVTNPDEPLGSPPPSYVPTFDPPPPPTPLSTQNGTADSSVPSRRSSTHSGSHLQASSSSQSSVPQKRSLSPFPSPPNSSAPSSPQPGRSRLDAHASSISVEQPPPPYMEELRSQTPPVSQAPAARIPPPPTLAPAPAARTATPDLPPPPNTPLRATHGTPDNTPNRRIGRTRPPLPQGPRKPSYKADEARRRAGSVSSLHAAGPSTSNSRMTSMMSHTAPKFQPNRVNYRGLTMEAAQWTLTSQQLQHIVSTAIRQSADASAIRILPFETLDFALPSEIEKLQDRCAELKTTYKLGVRKRNMLLANVSRMTEGGEMSAEQGATVTRMLEELGDVSESLDQAAEELYVDTDQLAQLHHLRDVHQRSALAMALRKLNSSFLKQVGEVQRLREQVAMLEAERDEAWREAQEVAQEFDDYTDRIMSDPSPGLNLSLNTASTGKSAADKGDRDKDSMTPSRRSSRVMVARKVSQRASKAGLRSMYRRSHRSSTSSNHRYSGAASPGVWSGPGGGEDIPPVPPIPMRHDLFFPSGDSAARSSMGTFASYDRGERARVLTSTWGSAESPSSDLRAMVQAQKELCEMLGISLDELKTQNHGPSRRQSMSAIPGVRSPASAAPTRRNSDIVTPNHQKSFKV
ncbi:hypothetical protein C8Q80DRAFT_1267222 [Daedaleopsis nitida]|nr:hypothetical protein C8Q80DRAFT_1267222 [Daedaleopsis nitida]